MLDQWSDDPSYDPDKLYLAGLNKYGVSKDTHVNLSPEIIGGIAAITSNKTLGYQHMSHFIRDAIVHRMHYWSERAPEFANRITPVMISAELESIENHEKTMRQNVESLESLLKRLNDVKVQVALLDQARKLMATCDVGTHWWNEIGFLLKKYDVE